MMACHFSFNLIDSIWVGRLIGPAALAAVSTAGFYVWVALSLGEMVEIGLIAVAARRHGERHPERAARAAAAAVMYALCAGLAVSIVGWSVAGPMFRLMRVPPEVASLGHAYLSTWLLGAPLVFGFFAIEATFRAALSLAGVLLSLVYMWLTRFTSRFGTAALAALGVGHKMEGLGFIAISGFSLAASALVGQNLGARQEARAQEAVRLTVGYCLMVTVTTAIAFLLIPDRLVSLFTCDPQVIADGVLYLRVIAFAQIGQSFELILEGALAGAGYTFWPQIVSTSLTAMRIPLAAWWSRMFGRLGIWLALSSTAIARGIAMMLFWKSGRWRTVKV